MVKWIPIYDDWRPKPPEFYRELISTVNEILLRKNSGGLFLCCGAGEHRAPLAGVVVLVMMGHSLESAIETVRKARTMAEILPVYKSSLIEFLRGNKNHV